MEEKNQSAEVSETNYPPLPPKITRENREREGCAAVAAGHLEGGTHGICTDDIG